ncbi:MAG: hypothetical protein ACOXZS_01680 [Bacilli bacterium]|jgi:ABC-type enterochelin transport system permease subunit
MKEAAGELNMTVVVIIAVGAILAFLAWFLPNVVFPSIEEQWKDKDPINPYQGSNFIEKVDINYYI